MADEQPTKELYLTAGFDITVDASVRSVFGSIESLPSPPASVLELNAAIAEPETSIERVGQVVSNDPAMSAKLLQLINSAFFGLNRRITNVPEAITYLGLNGTTTLLNAMQMLQAFSVGQPELTGDVETIHRHSIAVAELARSFITNRSELCNTFAAAMLHDIGLLALLATRPELYVEWHAAMQDGEPLGETETRLFGTTHADIGAFLLHTWGLPDSLVEVVAHSHDADRLIQPHLNAVHAVFVAEQIVNVSGPRFENVEVPSNDYLLAVGLQDAVADNVSRTNPYIGALPA
jgi:HD-like signal output (HDOD) protein